MRKDDRYFSMQLNIWEPSKWLLHSIEMHKKYRNKSGSVAAILRKIARLRYIFWSVVTSSDIDPAATIAMDLRLPHPNGVVIHCDAVIGEGCLIMQQVTIGQLAAKGAPVIGSNVFIGAGAKVLGPIVIGDGVNIGANAVVLCDLPPHCTAVGIPARIVRTH